MSHKAAFHALTLVSSGIFLVCGGARRVLFRRYGGQWGISACRSPRCSAAAVVLAAVLSSETARSGIRLAILRNFFSYRYDYRVEWLRCIEALSSDAAAAADLPERVIRALADIVNSPGGVLFQRHDEHALLPTGSGMRACPPKCTSRRRARSSPPFAAGGGSSPCARSRVRVRPCRPSGLAGDAQRVLAGRAAAASQRDRRLRAAGRAARAGPPGLGGLSICCASSPARRRAYLSEQQAQRTLADTSMLQEYSKRFAFVVHDIKNLSSQLGLILSNARRHAANPEFQADVMRTVENSVARMNKLMSQLKMATAPALPAAEAVRRRRRRSCASWWPPIAMPPGSTRCAPAPMPWWRWSLSRCARCWRTSSTTRWRPPAPRAG